MQPEIQVNLIYPVPLREALNTLIYTKKTRLTQGKDTRKQIEAMTDEEVKQELLYMANTVPSSWEFWDFKFEILNVTRAFTHQLVRTRTASYAQQAMRIQKMESFSYMIPDTIKDNPVALPIYQSAMQRIQEHYDTLLNEGIPAEDARGILPTNIHTNIIMKINLRGLFELVKNRQGNRVQGEYREVLDKMLKAVYAEYGTEILSHFLQPETLTDLKDVESAIWANPNWTDEEKTLLSKKLDKARKHL